MSNTNNSAPTEQSKVIFRRFVRDVMNRGDFRLIDELFADDFVGHVQLPPAPPMNRAGVKALFAMYHSAFSDFEAIIDELIAEGDKVAGLITVTGTHTGNFAGISATGNRVRFRTMDIFRIENDKIVEHWAMPDQYSLRQQLGVIPTPGQKPG